MLQIIHNNVIFKINFETSIFNSKNKIINLINKNLCILNDNITNEEFLKLIEFNNLQIFNK